MTRTLEPSCEALPRRWWKDKIDHVGDGAARGRGLVGDGRPVSMKLKSASVKKAS